MHIYFSGIGGTGIGPLALIAKQAGYDVSGSDEKDSQYIQYLKKQGIGSIQIGQATEQIAATHAHKPIDWYVHSSALPDNHPELAFCQSSGIKTSKRDEFLSSFITERGLKLVAIAGTHGKTTTTAMAVWLFKQLGVPISYSVGAKVSFGGMGEYDSSSEYFVYECDEFDRNFLAFHPYISLITGIGWDHHEIYHSQDQYNGAFRQFLEQSVWKILWRSDLNRLGVVADDHFSVLSEQDSQIEEIRLAGLFNRRDAFLVAQAVHELTKEPLPKLLNLLSDFPGISRRFEKITDNLYSDYAHTPEKIVGAMGVAGEIVARTHQKIIVIYEPLTNRRMHYTRDQHHDVFEGSARIYWVPSYLAREDPGQPVLAPEELIKSLNPSLQAIALPMQLDEKLKNTVQEHVSRGDLVLGLSGGGGGSLDEWLRKEFGQ